LQGALYRYKFGSVSPARFGVVDALALIAFAYFGGITMVSGALGAGVGATEGLVPRAVQQWFGVSGSYAGLVGGAAAPMRAARLAHRRGAHAITAIGHGGKR